MNPTHAVRHHARPECPALHKTLFFRGRGVLITEGCVQVHGTWHPIDALSGVRIARGPGGTSPAIFSFGALVAALGLCVGNVLVDSMAQRVMVDGGMGLVVAMLGGAAALVWQHRPYELWVRCQGDWLQLYSTRDHIEFGKFRRALHRAMIGEVRTSAAPDFATFR